jgi:hypothetical protein
MYKRKYNYYFSKIAGSCRLGSHLVNGQNFPLAPGSLLIPVKFASLLTVVKNPGTASSPLGEPSFDFTPYFICFEFCFSVIGICLRFVF